MRVVFRVDASSQIGIGHVMRCLTLAEELRSYGCNVSFVCQLLVGDMNHYIESKGFYVELMTPSVNGWVEDATLTKGYLSSLKHCDWLIVDHYELDKRWEKEVYSVTENIMVIDDLADRNHVCDLLLDQNFYQNMNARYEGLVPKHCKMLLGPAHVLLRKEFYGAARRQRVRDGAISNALIFFGGGDGENLTVKAISAIGNLAVDLNVDVVVGASNPFKNDVRSICEDLNMVFHCQTERMSELINQADICFGAGGATTWERAVLGLPTITVVCADNQLHTTVDMADINASVYIGLAEDVSEKLFMETLENLIESSDKVRQLSVNMRQVMGDVGERIESTAVEYLMLCAKEKREAIR